MLRPALHFALDRHLLQFPKDDALDFFGVAVSRFLGLGDAAGDLIEGVRRKVPKRQIFQLHFHPVDAQTIGQRRIDVHGFPRDVNLPLCRLVLQGSHIVDAVGQTNHQDADVGRHGQNHLPEIFSLALFL